MILSDEIRRRQREAAEEGRKEGLEKGIQQGVQQGIQQGMQQGMQQEREANVLGMLKEKIPMETISRITHYSLEQIQKLGKLHGLL